MNTLFCRSSHWHLISLRLTTYRFYYVPEQLNLQSRVISPTIIIQETNLEDTKTRYSFSADR